MLLTLMVTTLPDMLKRTALDRKFTSTSCSRLCADKKERRRREEKREEREERRTECRKRDDNQQEKIMTVRYSEYNVSFFI